MILIIDNYDSFTYNLYQYVGKYEKDITILRNDAVTIDEILKMKPSKIILSPGPKTPLESGICLDVIRLFHDKIPILGICLGHQAIGHVFGAEVKRAKQVVHGKTSIITHEGHDLFNHIPKSFKGARYHSLVIERHGLPKDLEVTATAPCGEIMGIRHKKHPTFGIQFHPESIFTEHGMILIENFLAMQ